MDDRRRDIGLFRYSLIREAADARLTHRERGELVRALAAADHVGPRGDRLRVSRPTLDRWIRAYRLGGFEALVPVPRRVTPRTATALLDLAVRLHAEAPRRSASQVAVIVAAQTGIRLSERTVQRHFARLGLERGGPPARRAFGRFEADRPNEMWTGDALHYLGLITARYEAATRRRIAYADLPVPDPITEE